MIDIILTLAVVAAVGAAVAYIINQKKKGTACIGCSMSGSCGKQKNGGCSCGK